MENNSTNEQQKPRKSLWRHAETIEEQYLEFLAEYGQRILNDEDMTREERIGYLLAFSKVDHMDIHVAGHWVNRERLRVLRELIPA